MITKLLPLCSSFPKFLASALEEMWEREEPGERFQGTDQKKLKKLLVSKKLLGRK